MASPVRRNPRARNFTLAELLESICTELSRPVRTGEADLVAPSMPTLKNWSRSGVFGQTVTLQAATKLAIATMRANPNYYLKSRSQASHEPESVPGPGPGMKGLSAEDGQEILKALHGLTQHLQSIEQRVHGIERLMGSSREPSPSQNATDGEMLQRLASAVNQLDAARRHMLVRYDSEIQQLRQMASGHGKSAEASQVLDGQRILARLSGIEKLLSTRSD